MLSLIMKVRCDVMILQSLIIHLLLATVLCDVYGRKRCAVMHGDEEDKKELYDIIQQRKDKIMRGLHIGCITRGGA